jgi:ribulose-phosphate 3-epimerase
MQIIPVINCPDLAGVQERIEVMKSFLKKDDYAHLDVADGVFTFHKTWSSPVAWRDMHVPFDLEVHLMVEHPEIWIEPWLVAGAKRFVVHAEVLTDRSFGIIAGPCKKNGVDIMISLNPETSVQALKPYLVDVKFFQVLAVTPGLAGQTFLPIALEKIMWIKRNVPHAIIEVDGGMNVETAKLVKDAGADVIVSSSYIFGSKDSKIAFEELKKI